MQVDDQIVGVARSWLARRAEFAEWRASGLAQSSRANSITLLMAGCGPKNSAMTRTPANRSARAGYRRRNLFSTGMVCTTSPTADKLDQQNLAEIAAAKIGQRRGQIVAPVPVLSQQASALSVPAPQAHRAARPSVSALACPRIAPARHETAPLPRWRSNGCADLGAGRDAAA